MIFRLLLMFTALAVLACSAPNSVELKELRLHDDSTSTSLSRNLVTYPNDPALLKDLGDALMGENKLGEAIAAYDRSLRLRPRDIDTTLAMGLACKENGDRRRAKLFLIAYLNLTSPRAELNSTRAGIGKWLKEESNTSSFEQLAVRDLK